MKLRHINPLGQVDVPLLRRQGDPFGEAGTGCLEPDEVVDVTEEQARQLLPQGDNYEPADDEATQLYQRMVLETADDEIAQLADAPMQTRPEDEGVDA